MRENCVCGHRDSHHKAVREWTTELDPNGYGEPEGRRMVDRGYRHTGQCEYVELVREPDIRDRWGIVALGRMHQVPCRCVRYNPKLAISTQRSFDMATRTWVAAHVLPVCPDCGADELYIDPNRGNARCYVCPFDDWAVRA